MTCKNCGAEIKMVPDIAECPDCHKDIKECIVDKDVTSSVYPM
jgi:Zn finger protein HypA/HybF involved in hydrogenase expression